MDSGVNSEEKNCAQFPLNSEVNYKNSKKRECYGASVILASGKIEPIFSRVTVLASGGAGQIYRWTTNPEIATGDGIAMSFRAGVQLKDLEFIQFHPTVLRNSETPLFLLSEALRGEGAHIVNSAGERFLFHHHRAGELAPRDTVARAIAFEEKRGGVFLDFTFADRKFLQKRFPGIYAGLKKRGFNLKSDRIPIAPAAHYLCGGVVTDLKGRTNLPRLFVIGEAACTGVHGANRLASNSLLEAVVFSEEAAKSATTPSPHRGGGLMMNNGERTKLPEINSRLDVSSFRQRVQELMWEKVGLLRTPKKMHSAVQQLKKWEAQILKKEKRGGVVFTNRDFAETKNLVQCARLVAEAACDRKKSLGTHWVENSQ
jgi:L-aspartate oxidase